MANNRMYIECTGCEEADLFYLAKRMTNGYYDFPKSGEADGWLDKHKHCGGTNDHFRLVYECAPNYDKTLTGLIQGKLSSPLFAKQDKDDEKPD